MRTVARRLLDLLLAPLWSVARFVYGDDPRRPERNPLEFALFAVICAANVRTAIGAQALPTSLQKTPDLFGQATAACFVLGAFIAMVGICWPGRDTRLVVESFGLVLNGFGLLCYGFALVNSAPWSTASVAISLSWGVAIGTGLRYAQISWFFRRQGERRLQVGAE